MATVTHLGVDYSCTTALKGDDYVHLLNEKGKILVAFEGVSDFSDFSIKGGSWVTPTPEADCYVAVRKDDGTMGMGTHKNCDLVKDDDLAPVATSGSYGDLTNIPTTFKPVSHTHKCSDLSDTLPIAKGGTGATSAAAALTALGGMKAKPANIEFSPGSSAGHGGSIDFHFNNSTADYTSRIIESTSGTLTLNGVTINGSTVTGALSGNASTATTLATSRTFRTNLASTSTASFNGSANVTPGVTGTLPVANGGTGATSAAAARNKLGVPTFTWTASTSTLTITL